MSKEFNCADNRSWRETNCVPEVVDDDRAFMFVVKNEDGSFIPEYDDDGTETNFRSIDKDKAAGLYIIGRGFKAGFNTSDGIIKAFDKEFKLSLRLDGNDTLIPVTEREDNNYKDIIQYKGFITDGLNASHVGNATLNAHTTSYHIGWKKKIQINDEHYAFVKIIFNIIMSKGISISLKISPNFNMNGMFLIDIGDKQIGQPIIKVGKGASTMFECHLVGNTGNNTK